MSVLYNKKNSFMNEPHLNSFTAFSMLQDIVYIIDNQPITTPPQIFII